MTAQQAQPHADITIAEFQQLIRDMYLEKDVARGVDGTFMWLMEEVGELASCLAQRHARRAARRIRRRAGLADDDRQRGRRRSDRGGAAKVRRRLPRLRPDRLSLCRCGEAMMAEECLRSAGNAKVVWCAMLIKLATSFSWWLRSNRIWFLAGFSRAHQSRDRRQPRCRRCLPAIASVLALLIAVCFASSSTAADSPASVAGVRVGFAGQYRVGCWTPVEVKLSGRPTGSERLYRVNRARRRRSGERGRV